MTYFKFNREKALAAILFISKKLIKRLGNRGPDIHKIFKILYFADQKHLARYGRFIVGDHYIAMGDGPVPSKIYDMVKIVRGDSLVQDTMDLTQYFRVSRHFVYPKQEPEMDEFSQSDLECIAESLRENQDLSFNELKEKSHDSAYESADRNDIISYREMAKVAGAKYTMLTYIQSLSENERILHK
jgi:uncharacterized phage-associated protein